MGTAGWVYRDSPDKSSRRRESLVRHSTRRARTATLASMCGINGIWDQRRQLAPEALVGTAQRMAAELKHRGPDAGDVWYDAAAGLALGHRRLSIIDLSPAGAQPMVSSCGRFVISFNGEAYNFAELRPELEAAGRRFRGHSDT